MAICVFAHKTDRAVFVGVKNPTGQTVSLKKIFLHKQDFIIFHSLCPECLSTFLSNAVVVRCPFSSFPLIVHCPILRAVVVHCLRCLPLSSSVIAIIVVRHCQCPPPPWSAAAAVITTLCLHRLLPSTLVHPLCSPPPKHACRCLPPLSLSAFVVVIRRRCLPPPQPSSPLRCLCCLSPPALVLPHSSPPPNHACCCHLPPLLSVTVIVCRRRTSTCPPSNKMLIVALQVMRDHHNRLFVMVLMYLWVDFWQWIDQIDPPTSFHSVFQPNPFQQQEKEHKKEKNDGQDWKWTLKKNEAIFLSVNSFPPKLKCALFALAVLHLHIRVVWAP